MTDGAQSVWPRIAIKVEGKSTSGYGGQAIAMMEGEAWRAARIQQETVEYITTLEQSWLETTKLRRPLRATETRGGQKPDEGADFEHWDHVKVLEAAI